MNFSRMRDIIEPHIQQIREHIFINSELAVIRGGQQVFQLIVRQKPPFTIDDYRLGILVKGEISVNLNLVEKHVTAGTLVFIGPGSVISPIRFSPDFEIYGVGLSGNFPMPFLPGQMPSAFNGEVRDFQVPVSEADAATALHIVETLWQIVHQPDYNRQTVSSLVAAQMHHYNGVYQRYIDRSQTNQSREQTIFDRFVYLVNQYAPQHHQMSFYAERMCLTERYLGTVVRQASGVTAKEWIDRAIVIRAKILLRNSDKTALQISEELGFPNPSFFSKYFKRLTGMTPLEYKTT